MYDNKSDATYYHAKLGLQDKGREIKGLLNLGSRALRPFKQSCPRLLSNIP